MSKTIISSTLELRLRQFLICWNLSQELHLSFAFQFSFKSEMKFKTRLLFVVPYLMKFILIYCTIYIGLQYKLILRLLLYSSTFYTNTSYLVHPKSIWYIGFMLTLDICNNGYTTHDELIINWYSILTRFTHTWYNCLPSC